MFESSQSTEKLDAALAKAQSGFKVARKDQSNPFYKSKYANLLSVWDACRDALHENQISVTQWPIHSSDQMVHLVTRIAHQGEWIKATFSMPVTKQDPQGYKSAVTYLRRTCLEAALGIVDDDDDGNAASSSVDNSHEYVSPPAPNYEEENNYGQNQFSGPPLQSNPAEAMFGIQQVETASDWVIPFGKFKNRKIGEITRQELTGYIGYLHAEAAKTGKPPEGSAKMLIDKAQAMWAQSHLKGL
jgi:ERF superfamily